MTMPSTTIQPDKGAPGEVRDERKPESVLLRATDLCKSYGGQVILDGISLELRQGDCVALVGPNGSGKTTLENILSGNLEPDIGTIQLFTNGRPETFSFPRPFWQNLNPFDHFTPERLAWEGVSKTWQEVRLFSSQSLLDNIAVAAPRQVGENPVWTFLRRRTVRQQEDANQNQSRGVLVRLGLGERATSSADKISLGQSKRIAIARAVHSGARILFLDEPLAGLDTGGIRDVLALLKELLQNHKLTLVIIEHAFNLPNVLDLVTKVWSLQDGKLHEEAKPVFQSRTRETLPVKIEELIRRFVPSGSEIRHEQLPGDAVLSRAILSHDAASQPVLEVENLTIHRGKRLVIGEQLSDGNIRGLSFKLCRNEIGFLQAPNGWGKTTLIEGLSGIVPPSSGSIKLSNQEIFGTPTWERSRLGLQVLQARNSAFSALTVRENLQLSGVSRVPPDLLPLLNRRVCNLSGGEKQRVALVSILNRTERAAACLLDEPFANLDANGLQHFLMPLLSATSGGALICIPGNFSP